MTEPLFDISTEVVSKIDDLVKQSWELRNTNTQIALEMALEANILSKKSNYTDGYVYSLRNMAVCNQMLAYYDQSLQQCFEAIPFFEDSNEKRAEAAMYSCIGTCFFMMSDHENSLMYHLKALKLREELNISIEHASSLLNIANVYNSLKNYSMALHYFKQSEAIAQQTGDKTILSRLLNGMGGVYSNKGDYYTAVDFFLKSLDIKAEIGDERSMASTLHNIGDCYIELREFDSAQKCLLESMKIAVEYGDKHNEAAYLRAVGKLFLSQGKFTESIDQTKRALLLYDSLKNKKDQVYCFKLLADAYLKLGDHKNALEFTNKHYQLKEEVFGQENAQRIENLNLLRQMELIKSESEIQRLRNVELKKAYEQIEVKNRSILDSIQYAHYIQELLLPGHNELNAYFPESFVFYKPKDIVSGDFFWTCAVPRDKEQSEVENISSPQSLDSSPQSPVHSPQSPVLIACVDCTGHGVPGAFMSLVSNNMLDVIVKQKGIVEPEQILAELNKVIHETFARNNDPHMTKGGLDIGLISIDLQTKNMVFSGVHNSIYVISENRLTEIKADKESMGSNLGTKFSRQEMKLSAGDCVYLFTDGFADQRGGEKRQKFYYQPFKDLLLELSASSMSEQKNKLDHTMQQWMNNREQMDDMTVIGVRI